MKLDDDGPRGRGAGKSELVYRTLSFFIVAYVIAAFGVYPLTTLPMLALALLGCGALAIAPKGAVVKVPLNLWLALLLIWITVSYTWSANIYVTKYTLRTEPLLTVAAVGAAAILPLARFKKALLRAVYLSVALTVFALLTKPTARAQFEATSGTSDLAGWHGFFVHKNAMTAFLTFGLVTVLAFEADVRRRRWFLLISSVLVVGAASGTGLSAFLVVAAVWSWLSLYEKEPARQRSSFLLLSGILFVVGIALVFAALPLIVNLYGKDLTFSGRTKIWSAAWWAIGREWFAGYGRAGVWTNGALMPTRKMVQLIGFKAGHAHNAYLEVLIEVGVVGLFLYLGLVVSSWKAAWRRFHDQPEVARWGLACIAGVFMFSLSESVVFGCWFTLLGWIYVLARRRHDQSDVRATVPMDHRSVTATLAEPRARR